MAVPRGLPAEGKEEVGGKVIPGEGGWQPDLSELHGGPFGWSWVPKDSGESLPLTEEWRHHLTVSVMDICLFLFSNFYPQSILLDISLTFIPYILYLPSC